MMQLDFYRPTDPALFDYIEGYYFLRGTEKGEELSYYTFPNNFFILSVLTGSQVAVADGYADCTPTGLSNFQSNLTCNYTAPLRINYQGPVNELTIYFKPLGLHAFAPVANYHQRASFDNFMPFADFEETMGNILAIADRSEQIELLEQYWLSKKTFELDELLLQMLNWLDQGKSISAIAADLGISRQYMNRLFLRQLAKTPSDFRKIQRFRNAVAASAATKNLTELALGNFFYDQSHFIRDVKELTSLSPKAFFEKATTKQENLWLYI
ncbi:helix-turn-helix domain-containing protein [Pedobacter sp. KR3-3]|uniref:Helix-turn-helix domain-containing protein n=1 Tax=Pedobacter albus TaxID=3113905 RepID=A0ABU7I4Q1_9SPHI|nr:helix-turn-helix domain-containing protein [Pedobacter sp. KR3-3]MEE1944362.1 helix-turn-helix domain-containing protein [Pedobacter sp. KR3-3]